MIRDAAGRQLLASVAVPRRIAVNAGGMVEPDATRFELVAEAAFVADGICQNPCLAENFKLVLYISRQ